MQAGLAARLGNIGLDDWTGRSVRLGTLWEQRAVVLAFIRHFG